MTARERLLNRQQCESFEFRGIDARARLRRQRHVECLHRLGPSPLFHLLTDLDAGKPIWLTVERYAALPADFIKALGGDRFAPSLHVIDGDGP